MLFPFSQNVIPWVFILLLTLSFTSALTEYVFYPQTVAKGDLELLDNGLKRFFGEENVETVRSTIDDRIDYWFIKAVVGRLPQDLPGNIKSGVEWVTNGIIVGHAGAIPLNGTGNGLNLTLGIDHQDLQAQRDAPIDLQMVSWPLNQKWSPFHSVQAPQYIYDKRYGKDIFVYVVDEGVDITHSDFEDMEYPPGSKDFIIARGAKATWTDDDPGGHGTCVASKVTGRVGGVSKNSRLKVVKMIYDDRSITDALLKVRDDVRRGLRQRKAVVVLPWSSLDPFEFTSVWPRGDPTDNSINLQGTFKKLHQNILELKSLGVPTVVAAGNERQGIHRAYFDTIPAMFAYTGSAITVGALDLNGDRAAFSQMLMPRFDLSVGGRGTTIWAPGEQITCAAQGTGTMMRTDSGTSFSAPMVAGLIAYFLGNPNNPMGTSGDITRQAMEFLRFGASRIIRVNPGKEPEPCIWNKNVVGFLKTADSLSLCNMTICA